MAALVNNRSVADVTLVGRQVTDEMVGLLSGAPAIRQLGLLRTSVTSGALAVLAGWPNLEALSLNDSGSITDAAIPALSACKSLRFLGLHGTAISAEGRAALAAAFPYAWVNIPHSSKVAELREDSADQC